MKIKILTNIKFGAGDDDVIIAGTILSEPFPECLTDLNDTRIIAIIDHGESKVAEKPKTNDTPKAKASEGAKAPKLLKKSK